MEGMEAAVAKPASGSSQRSTTWSRIARLMQATSAMERNGAEPQLDNEPFPRPQTCLQEDRAPSLLALQPPRAWALQFQGPSVLESKVKALKEKKTASKQGASLCPPSHKHPSSKRSRGQRVKAEGVQTPSEGSPLPDAGVAPDAQNLSNGQLENSVNKEEAARNGDSRPFMPPAPGLEGWKGQSPWPPEARWGLLGPRSLQESPIHRATPGLPWRTGPCKITHMSNLEKGRLSSLRNGVVTGEDLDSTSLTSKEDLVPRTVLLGRLWRARDMGALGTGGSALSLSDQVERNRLVLQEMLKVSGQSPLKVETPTCTPSWDRAVPEQPVQDVDWDSGISLQDSDSSRTFGPKLEPVLSPRHEEAKHLLQCARMKARTRPLRASHDIVPSIAQGSRDGGRNPGLEPRMPLACRDSVQNGNVSDSSSGDSSSGQWPKRGVPASHVRFEDESAGEAESRYQERLQQRQRPGLRAVLQDVGQGPLRSKPDLADYVCRDAGKAVFHEPVGGPDCIGIPVPTAAWGNEWKCQACGSCLNTSCPDEGKAAPGPRVPEAACSRERPQSSYGRTAPHSLLPTEPGLHTEWIRETHIGDATPCPEEEDSAPDSAHTLDSEEVGSPWLGGAAGCLQGSRPQGDHKWPRKSQRFQPEADDVGAGAEVKGRGHRPEGTLCLRGDAGPKPPALEPEGASLGLGGHCTHPMDSWAPCRPACATVSSMHHGLSEAGRPGRVIGSLQSLEITCAASLQQSQEELSASHPAQQSTMFCSPGGWVPTPPASRKATRPVPHRKAALAGPPRPGDPTEPVGTTLLLSPTRTVVLSSLQTQGSPQVRHPLLDLSTNNCNNRTPLALQEPSGAAVPKSRAVGGPCGQELELSLESQGQGGLGGSLGSADVATVNSSGITVSLASEKLESSQELRGGLQRAESSSGGHVPCGPLPGAGAGPTPPSAVPSDGNKKRSSIASTLGLKKLFSALGHVSGPKLGKSRSYSVEQLPPSAPGPALHYSTPKTKRAPSLQSLHLVSPSHQYRKAASFQNLHSLLSGKGDRSSLYLVEGPGDPSVPGRPATAPPRHALSVEDVSAPSLARTVGRVVEVFPDGTSQLRLQRPTEGTFGFCVAYGSARRDSGLYVQEMADPDTAKLYSGLLGVGDEILEVNGAKVARLGLAHIKELLAHSESLLIRVLRQRPLPR